MFDRERHADWLEREFDLIWDHGARAVLETHALSALATALEAPDEFTSDVDINGPLTPRVEAVAAYAKEGPAVHERPGTDGIQLEMPAGSRLATPATGSTHRLDVRIAPPVSLPIVGELVDPRIILQFKIAVTTTATGSASSVDTFFDLDISVDPPGPDWLVDPTGDIRRSIRAAIRCALAPWLTASNMFTHIVSLPLGDWNQWLYNREIPEVPAPRPIGWMPHHHHQNAGWRDVVIITNGFVGQEATRDRTVDSLLALFRDTPSGPDTWTSVSGAAIPRSADAGATDLRMYGDIFRTWLVDLQDKAQRVTGPASSPFAAGNEAPAGLLNLAALAEVGLQAETAIRSRDGRSPKAGAVLYVMLTDEPVRAKAMGNFIMLDDGQAARTMDNGQAAATTLVHEFGHWRPIALADEYRHEERGRYRGPEPEQANVSKGKDPDKWSRFLDVATIAPVEGGLEYPHGLFRPVLKCRMGEEEKQLTQDFCPVCRDAIMTGLSSDFKRAGRVPVVLQMRMDEPAKRVVRLVGAGDYDGVARIQVPVVTDFGSTRSYPTSGVLQVEVSTVPSVGGQRPYLDGLPPRIWGERGTSHRARIRQLNSPQEGWSNGEPYQNVEVTFDRVWSQRELDSPHPGVRMFSGLATGAASPPPALYLVRPDGRLAIQIHQGALDSGREWRTPASTVIGGSGWDSYIGITGGPHGWIHGILPDGRMHLYQHTGQAKMEDVWLDRSARTIGGNGWADYLTVFAGEWGSLYGVTAMGELHFYQYRYLSGDWGDAGKARTIGGNGWAEYTRVFSGSEGVIYAVTSNGQLHWYRYDADSNSWANSGRARRIGGSGWGDYGRIESAGNGWIYAVARDQQVHFYVHTGWQSGADEWASRRARMLNFPTG